MQSSMSFEELKQLIQNVMIKEGINEYDIHMKGQLGKGENYIGEVEFFRVVPKNGGEVYNLVVKSVKKSEEIRKTMPIVAAHKRESFMYRIVFPEMKKFLELSGEAKLLDYVPKMYSVCDEDKRESLILENLKYLGYRMVDRKKPLDLNHALLVSKIIGKYHAISFAMNKMVPEVFRKITKGMSNVFDDYDETLNSLYVPLLENAYRLLEKSDKGKLSKKFEETIRDDTLDGLFPAAQSEDQLVISHGDCWGNNILFKYENSDALVPSGLCLVDFQLAMLDSPVKDLSFFLYVACNKSVLDNFELFLQTYHASLSTTLEILGCKSDDCFTYEQLMDHWKKYAIYGVKQSTFFIKIGLLESEEVLEVEGGVIQKDKFNFKMKNEVLYNSRIFNVFTHFGEKFL